MNKLQNFGVAKAINPTEGEKIYPKGLYTWRKSLLYFPYNSTIVKIGRGRDARIWVPTSKIAVVIIKTSDMRISPEDGMLGLSPADVGYALDVPYSVSLGKVNVDDIRHHKLYAAVSLDAVKKIMTSNADIDIEKSLTQISAIPGYTLLKNNISNKYAIYDIYYTNLSWRLCAKCVKQSNLSHAFEISVITAGFCEEFHCPEYPQASWCYNRAIWEKWAKWVNETCSDGWENYLFLPYVKAEEFLQKRGSTTDLDTLRLSTYKDVNGVWVVAIPKKWESEEFYLDTRVLGANPHFYTIFQLAYTHETQVKQHLLTQI